MTDSQPGDTFQPGDVLNNTYRIEAILGRGGTSEVYRARSEINRRVLALKVLSSAFSDNDDFRGLMIREEEIREVRHDAVVRYSEISRSQDGHIYLVMDYIDGQGLDQKLRSGGMTAEDLLAVARRVLDGLVATHAHNIVHRDLSPDNVILRNGDPARAVIIDYGIAKDSNPGAATIVGNEFAGKYAYAAPEQLNGRADARSDLYALGALLLALFRGARPDVGRNPMEVIQRKAKPLDTSGVPEPLKSLIDGMAHPVPDRRFQTAQAAIEAIPGGPPLGWVVPPTQKAGRRGLGGRAVALAAVGLLLLAGGGAYWSGGLDRWLSPAPPEVSPYKLVAEKAADGQVNAAGYVPSADAKSTFDDRVAAMGGTSDLELAPGDVPADWAARILDLVTVLEPLDEWRIAATGPDVQVGGLTSDRALRDAVVASLSGLAAASDLRVAPEIVLGPRVLDPTEVTGVLDTSADCGSLRQVGAPAEGYALGTEIVVAGSLGSENTRAALLTRLIAIAGDRAVVLDVDVQNAHLCRVRSRLPVAPAGGFGIVFADGASGAINADGVFPVGANPAIDVTIPAGIVDGSLWVTIVDVTGNAFHLLPNSKRPDSLISDLRDGRTGDVSVRVAYSLDEASADPTRLAFLVDETLGESEVLVILSTGELFDELRPATESVNSYLEALEERLKEPAVSVRAIYSRTLSTG